MRLGLAYKRSNNFIKHYEEKKVVQCDLQWHEGWRCIDILGNFIEWSVYRKQKEKNFVWIKFSFYIKNLNNNYITYASRVIGIVSIYCI